MERGAAAGEPRGGRGDGQRAVDACYCTTSLWRRRRGSRQIASATMLSVFIVATATVSHASEKAAIAASRAAEAPRDPSEKSVTTGASMTLMQPATGDATSATNVVADGATTAANNSENCKANASALRACSPTPHHDTAGCFEACRYAGDGECDDGGPGREFALCAYGSDCGDCGARATLCANGCAYHFDGDCDDGGPSAPTRSAISARLRRLRTGASGAEHGPPPAALPHRRVARVVRRRRDRAHARLPLAQRCLRARATATTRARGACSAAAAAAGGAAAAARAARRRHRRARRDGARRWRAPSGLVVVEGIVVRPAGAAAPMPMRRRRERGGERGGSSGSGAASSESGEEAPAAAAAPSGPVVVEGRRVLL